MILTVIMDVLHQSVSTIIRWTATDHRNYSVQLSTFMTMVYGAYWISTYTLRTFRLLIKFISLRNTWRTAGQIWVFLCECLLQCNDETRQWRQWLRTVHIVTHATVWILISYTYHQGITYTNVKIHSFNVPLQGFMLHFQFLESTPLCYEQQKQFNIHRHSPSVLSVYWY